MKIAISTCGWGGISFEDFIGEAIDQSFEGIEIDRAGGVYGRSGEALAASRIGQTSATLGSRDIAVSVIGADCDISSSENVDADTDAILSAIDMAKKSGCQYVRLTAEGGCDPDAVRESVIDHIGRVLDAAVSAGVTLLVESTGVFADTSYLRDTLNVFANDSLAVLWSPKDTIIAGESAETTVQNLGAYIEYVHVCDFTREDDAVVPALVGEGELPFGEIMDALRSVSYDGYLAAVCDPTDFGELGEAEIIFPQYANFMRSIMPQKKKDSGFFENRSHTGKYIWRHDELIDKTFSEVLDTMADTFPDQRAIRYTTLDYTRTYSEFRDDVDTFARSLIALGVKTGDHVAVWATNVPQWYIAFWATTKIGAVLVTVNTDYKIHEAEYLLKQSDTHTLIMVKGNRDSDYSAIIEELCPELKGAVPGKLLHCRRFPFLRNIITVGFKLKGALPWESAVDMAVRVPLEEVYRRASAVDVDFVCNMQYTSGTTGFPKGVMLTHRSVVNNGKCIGDRMDLSTADRMMIQVPMFHCFGMVLAMTAAMTHGATIMPLPYFSPKSSLACINQEKITCFHGVPTMYIAMLRHEDFSKTDFSHIRTGIMAGSNCPAELMREAAEKMGMREITSVYGQTEASPGCTMGRYEDTLDVRVETVGPALPGVECRIVDPETGAVLPDGETGEFVARGYNVMKGYYKMPSATAAAIDADGWLHTGDLACRTPEGNYKITGRLKDMIIRGGENIYPREIEEFLFTSPKVKDVQVIGVPDERYGEEIMASIILKDGETMTEDEVKDFVRANMARHKVPRYVEFVDSFPMNGAKKILKYKMREAAIEKYGLTDPKKK